MALPFSITGVTELFVEAYSGFDRPAHKQLVAILSDGTSENDQVLQSSGLPYRQASVGGALYSQADVDALRLLDDTGGTATFVDGDGNSYTVRVLTFSAVAFTERWAFSMNLLDVT